MEKNIFSALIISLCISLLTIFSFMMMKSSEASTTTFGQNDNNGKNIGIIEVYSGSNIPSGYLECNGQAVSRTTYSELFSVIGTTYGSGDGSTTFNLPNLNGRNVVGKSASTFTTLGGTGGSINTTLVAGNIPSHNHSIPKLTGTAASNGAHTHEIPSLSGTTSSAGTHTHDFSYNGNQYWAWEYSGTAGQGIRFFLGDALGRPVTIASAGAHTHKVTTTASTTGSDGSHTHDVTTAASTTGNSGQSSPDSFTNLQPYLVVNYIIKY